MSNLSREFKLPFMRKSVFYAIGAAVLLWTAVAFSCTSEQAAPDRLPEAPVHVHLSKADARYKELWQPGGIAIIDRPQVAGEAVGVAGLIVVQSITSQGVFYAFDRACPNSFEKIEILSIENMEAVCPHCGSRYTILHGTGAPVSGPAVSNKAVMRRYTVQTLPDGLLITR
ncbi:hypothetical protein [Porphyromonas macacae]|uniref:hypothetical protein n=1 Tax=Porphyromonas macacae TaxID=28115 RepID=UPI001269E419|nr:hypothetical protein [Porphyromonas macacae]